MTQTQTHPVIERYLVRFMAAFDAFETSDRDEIIEELRNHLAEARAAGQSLDEALETLGPADELARAYAVELALHPKTETRTADRAGVLASLRAGGARRVRAAVELPRAVGAAAVNLVRAIWQLLVAAVAWGFGRVAAGARLGWRALRGVARGGYRAVRWVGTSLLRLGQRCATLAGRIGRGTCRRAGQLGRGLGTLIVAAPRGAWQLLCRLPSLGLRGARRARAAGGTARSLLGVGLAGLAATLLAAFLAIAGAGIIATGAVLLASGVVELGNIEWLQIPPTSMPPAAAMTVGPLLMAAGAGVLLLLRLFVGWISGVLARAYPAGRISELARAMARSANEPRATPPVANPAPEMR